MAGSVTQFWNSVVCGAFRAVTVAPLGLRPVQYEWFYSAVAVSFLWVSVLATIPFWIKWLFTGIIGIMWLCIWALLLSNDIASAIREHRSAFYIFLVAPLPTVCILATSSRALAVVAASDDSPIVTVLLVEVSCAMFISIVILTLIFTNIALSFSTTVAMGWERLDHPIRILSFGGGSTILVCLCLVSNSFATYYTAQFVTYFTLTALACCSYCITAPLVPVLHSSWRSRAGLISLLVLHGFMLLLLVLMLYYFAPWFLQPRILGTAAESQVCAYTMMMLGMTAYGAVVGKVLCMVGDKLCMMTIVV